MQLLAAIAKSASEAILVTKGPLRDAQSKTFCTFGIARDITGRRVECCTSPERL
ncbi:hypothetical protein ACVC7V_09945 [Hydrogenophaga sp. A37]|uniref:hypothetical protein n=1 Tax=Hydrogenophaga sp. A37 TaxID=1945864 RepID=UPI0015C57FF2|nr:hypothetical protein [Hydrogenophaga sp. A37]